MANTSSSLDLQTSSKGQQEYQAQLRCWIQNIVAVAVAETEEERVGKSTYQPKYSPYNVEFAGDAKAQELGWLDSKLLKAFQEVFRALTSLRAARTRISSRSQGMAWEGLIDSVGSFACRLTDSMPSEGMLTSHAMPGEETNRSNIGSEDLEFLEQHRPSLREALAQWIAQSNTEVVLMKQRLDSVWQIAKTRDEWTRAYLDSNLSAS
ncbi:MAG: hypothetical protein Q9228_004636 [Teloschistes exilis]